MENREVFRNSSESEKRYGAGKRKERVRKKKKERKREKYERHSLKIFTNSMDPFLSPVSCDTLDGQNKEVVFMKLKILLIATICTAALSACANPGASTAGDTTAKASETVKETAGDKTSAASEENSQEAGESSESTADMSGSSKTDGKESAGTETAVSGTVDLETILSLMGKNDSEVVSALGEGEPMDNDGTIINRDYTWNLFGGEVSATTYFNLYQEGKNLLEQCTINLPENDLEKYAGLLEETLGKPTETYEKSYFYETETASVVLANPYDDAPYIEISMKQE